MSVATLIRACVMDFRQVYECDGGEDTFGTRDGRAYRAFKDENEFNDTIADFTSGWHSAAQRWNQCLFEDDPLAFYFDFHHAVAGILGGDPELYEPDFDKAD